MRAAFLTAALLLSAGLVAAPAASAADAIPHPCDAIPAGNETCWLAANTVVAALSYVDCYRNTSPKFWVSQCA